jgi:uncharacterized membrane protein
MASPAPSSRHPLRSRPHADEDPASSNIEVVAELERDSQRRRSRFDCVIDAVRAWAANPMFILLHVVVIGVWIGVNVRGGGFDPYPFGFLNMSLAMEAIFLSSFVLMAQDRMTRDADRRDHLNLQVDLLAEQELTAILNVVVAIANRAGIDVEAQIPEIDRLRARTDVHKLATSLERQLDAQADAGKRKEGVAGL